MRIAEINTSYYGSTGRIMLGIGEAARRRGHTVRTYSKLWRSNPEIEGHGYVGNKGENILHRIGAPLSSADGNFSAGATDRLIAELREFSPDIIHLHNIHGWYLNYERFFNYLREDKVRVVWTLHDCWPFTGQCAHFLLSGCDKWKRGCGGCDQYRKYPEMLTDGTRKMWQKKKELFCGVENMTLVTPSNWLSELTRESFLSDYPVRVINNGIDISVFAPRDSAAQIKRKYGCENKKIILGVSFVWKDEKGLDVFLALAERLPMDYAIVLVGVDGKLAKKLPKNIISIGRTESREELAALYSAADIFVNPTREDNFPTVNIEALASGTPVLTFDVGGSAEMIDGTCGSAVAVGDVDAMEREILRICRERPYSAETCRRRGELYDADKRFEEYVDLYEE